MRVAPFSSVGFDNLNNGNCCGDVMNRERLPNRRLAETFEIEVTGLRYAATVGYYPNGRIGELFIANHKSNSAADVNARDSAIAFSFAVQHGADPHAIRRALCRDSHGRASGPLGAALAFLLGDES
jgi:ribonucleoside-diphosphate reductase alpha chain